MNLRKWLSLVASGTITIVFSMILGFGGFDVLSSQASPIGYLAQTPAQITADSFVAAAVTRTGPAVVRIDTETVVTRQVDPFLMIRFSATSLVNSCGHPENKGLMARVPVLLLMVMVLF